MSMTKDDIITLPNAHLRQRSQRVGVVTDETRQLAADMIAATLDWEDDRQHEVAVALAAIQIDKPYRVIIVRNNFDDRKDRTFTVFVNPVITKYEGTVEEDYEGCLSIQDLYGLVPRHTKVRVKALDLSGREFRLTAEGFLARLLQHEIDHTNGIVFVDHIHGHTEAFFKLSKGGKLEALDYEKEVAANKDLWESVDEQD